MPDLVLDNKGDDDIDEDDDEDGGDAHKAKYDYDGDDDQFGQIDASQQFGQPPSTVHGLLLNYSNVGRTTFNYNTTSNAIQLTTAVLAHSCATLQ